MITIERVEVDVRKLRRLLGNVDADTAVERMARELEVEIDEGWSISSPAPEGEAPGVDTGALSNSIHAAKISDGVWAVRDGVEYGIYHEIGTVNIAARPWMVPAVERVRGQWPGVMRTVIAEAI